MDAKTGIIEYCLAPRSAMVLEQAAGFSVRCDSGRVWITQYGDSRDIVLQDGASFDLSLPNVVVMASSEGARLVFRRTAAAPAPRGWLPRLAACLDPRNAGRVTRQLQGRLPVLRLPAGAAGGGL